MTIIRFDQRVQCDEGDDYRRTVLLGESDFDCTADIDDSVTCVHCGQEIAHYVEGWLHEDTSAATCQRPTGEDEDDQLPTAEPGRSLPGNWVGMSTDVHQEAVAVQISVGDPRGCFEFTLRRWVDPADGKSKLLLHMPHPGESTPHMTLTPLHEGTYIVGG